MALTATEIVSEFGSYYRKEGQGAKDIIGIYYQPSVTQSYFNPTITENTQERRSKFLKGRVLQQYQKAFTPVGGGTFKPSKIDLAWMKIDEQETPSDLEKSWVGFLNGIDSNDRKNYPFVRWYMEHIIMQSIQDYEVAEVYKGVEGAITPGTATAAGASMNGLGEQIRLGILGGEIVPVTSPTWSTDPATFVTQIETWVADVAALTNEDRLMVENELDYLFMSIALRDRYADGLAAKYNVSYNQTGLDIFNKKSILPIKNQNIKVVGLPSMTGRNRIFMTPSENRAAFDRKAQSATGLEIESVDRTIKIFGDIHKGIGFWYKPFVKCNQLV